MSDKKSWTEVIMMPLVVAIVGIAGTLIVTNQQTKNASILADSQRENAIQQAEADRQIKILEIFAEKITSPEESQRLLGLRLLGAIDSVLAERLASAVAETEPQGTEVRRVADEVASAAALRSVQQLQPRVYLHIRSESVRPHMQTIASALEAEGLIVPGVERIVRAGPSSTQLRYFRRSEKAEAERIGGVLEQAGVDAEVTYIGGYETSTGFRPLHYELWFGPNEPAAP